jgi:hypothetical protein
MTIRNRIHDDAYLDEKHGPDVITFVCGNVSPVIAKSGDYHLAHEGFVTDGKKYNMYSWLLRTELIYSN